MRTFLGILGFGVLLTAGIAAVLLLAALALLVAPALVAVAWNLLDFGEAIGAGSLGFWGCVLLGWFLASPFWLRLVIVLVVFIADPVWFHKAGELHWPEPTLRNPRARVGRPWWLSACGWHSTAAESLGP